MSRGLTSAGKRRAEKRRRHEEAVWASRSGRTRTRFVDPAELQADARRDRAERRAQRARATRPVTTAR